MVAALEQVGDRKSNQCLPIPGKALEMASQMAHCCVPSTKHRIWNHGDKWPSSALMLPQKVHTGPSLWFQFLPSAIDA